MRLSDLIGKTILVNNKERGICRGVGVSLSAFTIKYLFCESVGNADFAVGISAVKNFGDCIALSALRSVYPRSCAKLFPNIPVYSTIGESLGKIVDADIRNLCVEYIYTDENERYPFSWISAGNDAVILKKIPVYPLGQRIPAYSVYQKNGKNNFVTKSILSKAVKEGNLVSLTLSLPPFSLSV